MPFTREVKKKYIDEGGEVCPYCGGRNIESTEDAEEYETHYQSKMHCDDLCGCGKYWWDVYKLVSIAEIGDDS